MLTLEEGIRRMTSMPAERGTVEAPNAYPVGIRAVLVNGAVAFQDDAFADARAGHVLRRTSGSAA